MNKGTINIFLAAAFLFSTILTSGQTPREQERLIEVNGSAEMEIEPDEIEFVIGIEEYWKEEFEKRKDFEDYKTKVPLSEIEDNLIKNLRKAGIDMADVKVINMGNYWRFREKEFLYSKQLSIKVRDLSMINKLTDLLDAKGIKYMNIRNLDHSEIENYKKQVRINALKNAREKAQYLTESIGSQLGEVVTISEMADGYNRPVYPGAMMMRSADMAKESVDQVQNIKLEYQVRATFRIK